MPDTAIAPEPTETATDFLTRALDKVAPVPKSAQIDPAPVPQETIPEVPKTKTEPTSKSDPVPADDKPLPSFLSPAPEEKPTETKVDEWPEELPGEKDEKKQADYKKWRQQYQARGTEAAQLKAENEGLKKRTGSNDPEIQNRLKQLETENGQYKEKFDKVYVESSDWYQNTYVKPREQAVNSVKQIVKDVGGDVDSIDKIFNMNGKAYWEELENLSVGLPESAKIQLNNLVNGIRSGDQQRDQVLAQSKQTAEQLRQHELQNQKHRLQQDVTQTKTMLGELISDMRGKGLEVLQRTTDPKAQWWNTEVVDVIEKGAEDALLNNPDPRKLAAAVVLGYSADQYRTMWQKSENGRLALQKRLDAIDAASPSLEDGSGGMPNGSTVPDAKKPLKDIFKGLLEEQRNKR